MGCMESSHEVSLRLCRNVEEASASHSLVESEGQGAGVQETSLRSGFPSLGRLCRQKKALFVNTSLSCSCSSGLENKKVKEVVSEEFGQEGS